MKFILRGVALTLVLLTVRPAHALGPMYSYHDLVAGEGTAGMEDGPFYSALFHTPLGLAVDPASNRLYVADRDNHCLRVVDLSNENKVSTLVGNGKQGYTDGPFAVAAFYQPSGLVLLPGRRIAVSDNGNARIRLVDLDKETVTTLAGTGENGIQDGIGTKAQAGLIWNMFYWEPQDALYFSQPDLGTLRKLDLKTLEVTTFLKNDSQLPNPAALCATKDKFYVADRKQAVACQFLPDTPPAKAPTPVVQADLFKRMPMTTGDKVLSMAWSDHSLYAVEANVNTPVACLLPAHRVDFMSVWGELLKNPGVTAFLNDVQNELPLSLVPDPSSDRKFYIAHPLMNAVTSFRDLNFMEEVAPEAKNSTGLMDFEYPLAKPANVYRVLLIGDSHLFQNYHGEDYASNRMELIAKRLELILNTSAAMEGVSGRFEVITQALVSHEPVNLWPYYSVPKTVKQYDIDLVFLLQTSINYSQGILTYIERPLTAEGIPAAHADPEYVAKPWPDKVKQGFSKEFYDLCLQKKLVTITPKHQLEFKPPEELCADPEVLSLIVKMYSKPLKMLKGKLAAMKTTAGGPVSFETCFIPLPRLYPVRYQRPFWQGVRAALDIPFLDMEAAMTALRVSYYPLSRMDDYDHFNNNGNLLIALALGHELIREKMIPFEPKNK